MHGVSDRYAVPQLLSLWILMLVGSDMFVRVVALSSVANPSSADVPPSPLQLQLK
jgi:hypothetical protein